LWTRKEKIFKRPPRPHPATDKVQTTSFGKLMTHTFQKYMSAKVPRGGGGIRHLAHSHHAHQPNEAAYAPCPGRYMFYMFYP
jgi:hypothetical protein